MTSTTATPAAMSTNASAVALLNRPGEVGAERPADVTADEPGASGVELIKKSSAQRSCIATKPAGAVRTWRLDSFCSLELIPNDLPNRSVRLSAYLWECCTEVAIENRSLPGKHRLFEFVDSHRFTFESNGPKLQHDRTGWCMDEIAPNRDLHHRAITLGDLHKAR